MADVFVSYTASDRDRVAQLVEALQAAGLSVWWDRGIDVGSTFDREIERELDAARCVVVVWSNASVDSEWVRNEAFEAQSRNALFPILISDVKPPLAFRRAQTARMIEWPASVGEFDAMLRAIHGRLAKMPLHPESQRSQTHVASSMAADANAPSIAVLPLSNVSPDPDQVHFVDGLTIELIHRLSRIPNLRIVGQASSFAYKNRPVSYAEVGRTLGVAHLLEGSVRRVGDQLRVTVELVSCANGFQLWSADFDRKLDDVFAIQREISDAVADALTVKLRGDSLELLGSTSNASAHAHYLRGNALLWQFTVETAERSVAECEAAVAIDPGFARGWATLAYAYGFRSRQPERTEQGLRDMSNAVERALEIEPRLWLAQWVKGSYLLSRRQFVAGDAVMMECVRLVRSGQESVVGREVTNYLIQFGRWTEQLEYAERFESVSYGAVHPLLYVLDRKEEARDAFARLRGLYPVVDRDYLLMLAMDQPSAEEADRIMEGFSKTPLGRAWFGKSDDALVRLRQRLASGKRFLRGDFTGGAMIAAHHGDIDLAIDLLRAEFLVDGFGSFYPLWFPQLKQVRASPKFKTFLIDLGLPEMWRKSGSWGDFCEPVGDYDFRCH